MWEVGNVTITFLPTALYPILVIKHAQSYKTFKSLSDLIQLCHVSTTLAAQIKVSFTRWTSQRLLIDKILS